MSRPWPRLWTVLIGSAALPVCVSLALGLGLSLAGCGKSTSSGGTLARGKTPFAEGDAKLTALLAQN